MNWNAACIPLWGLLADLLLVLALARRGVSLLKSVYAGFLLGAIFVASKNLAEGAEFAQLAADMLSFGALGYGFFHFVNMGETARRIRLLSELRENGPLSEQELLSRYNARQMVEARLARLERNGQARVADGKVFLAGTSVLRMARIMDFMKLVLLGKNMRTAR